MSARPDPTVEVAWRGEAVTIGEVLSALSEIRRKFAHSEAGDQEHPHPRNFVMTLVAVATSVADESRAQTACMAIAAQHPSLAIVVCEEPSVRAGRIDAAITTHALDPSRPDSPRYAMVTLRVAEVAGEHLAAVVDPLLLSGVPTYLWWLDTPPFGTKELMDALKVCDAIVVDSARFDRPYHSFRGLADLALTSHSHLGIADFQWARLEPWRETIAQFFEPKDRRPYMGGIAEIGIDYVGEGRGNRIGAALLVGWFSSALGWKIERAVGGGGGVVVAHFSTTGGRQLEVSFRSVPKPHLAKGEVCAVRIAGASEGGTFRLSVQRDPERRHMVTPDVGPAPFKPQHHTGGEDDAGYELAQRQSSQHRAVLHQNREALHHTATGDLPGEPPHTSSVLVRDRRFGDSALVLLTMIDMGEAKTLRHLQRIDAEEEAALLVNLLSNDARDPVYARSLAAATELMRTLKS